jgi:hypothetical protein
MRGLRFSPDPQSEMPPAPDSLSIRVTLVGGTARVESVEPDKVQPVYNLDVAENRDFFVGKNGCLVYDCSIVQPVVAPFDHAPDLAALEPKAK